MNKLNEIISWKTKKKYDNKIMIMIFCSVVSSVLKNICPNLNHHLHIHQIDHFIVFYCDQNLKKNHLLI